MKRALYLFITLVAINLLTRCIGEGSNQNRDKIISPPNTIEIIEKPVVNVYIENSASMDGYVKGITEFEQAVYSYLSGIKISDVTDTLNLYYINSSPISYAANADIDVISDFIEKLEPTTFRQRGGNRSTTDISNVFKAILAETRENDVAILVTDGIFSPGRGKDAAEYLVNQQIGVKNTIAEYLKKYPNTAIVVYQLSSKFTSNATEKIYYYNREDKPIEVNAQRPYYIWIIGNVANITLLKANIPETTFKGGGVQHSFTFLPSLEKEIDYAILNTPKFGSFKRDKKSSKTSIYDIKKAKSGIQQGKFMFTIGMDLSLFSILLGDEYLLNTESYARLINKQPNNDYFIEMEDNTNPLTNYTHNMKLTADKISVGELEIILRNNLPVWVSEINDDEGLDIHINNAINKTFGIKYLVEGIYEAYQRQENTIYTTMKFNLKK